MEVLDIIRTRTRRMFMYRNLNTINFIQYQELLKLDGYRLVLYERIKRQQVQ